MVGEGRAGGGSNLVGHVLGVERVSADVMRWIQASGILCKSDSRCFVGREAPLFLPAVCVTASPWMSSAAASAHLQLIAAAAAFLFFSLTHLAEHRLFGFQCFFLTFYLHFCTTKRTI